MIRRINFGLLLPLCTLIFPVVAFGCGSLVIDEAWVREPPPVATMAAAYFRITNNGPDVETIEKITSTCCGDVYMHRSVTQNNQVHMSHIDSISLQPNETLRFESGGMHLMLAVPAAKLHLGDHVEITFICSNGESATADFDVLKMR